MKAPNSHTNPINKSLDEHPFIWGNIALLAGVPWLLALSMSGLAVGAPVFPAWFEIFLLGLPAIALVTWVQWQQPISPFSLWFVAKPIESLSDRDRQILTFVKQNQNGWYVTGWMAIALSIVMSAIFCKIYIAAPLAQAIAPFPSGLRLFGIVWAEIFFVLSNVLLQAGISALRIKLTPESELSGLQPFAVEKIKNSFTNVGWRSPQILKFFEQEAIVDAPETREAFSSESVDLVEDEVKAELVLSNPISEPEIDQLIDEPKIEISETSLDVEIIHSDDFEEVSAIGEADINTDDQHTEEIDFLDQLEISEIIAEEALIASLVISETIENITETESEIVDEESRIEETENLDEQIDTVEIIEEDEVEVFLDITDTDSAIEITESISELIDEQIDELETFTEEYAPILDDQNVVEIEVEDIAPTIDVDKVFPSVASSSGKKAVDFLRKSRKISGAHKKKGFGKSVKHAHDDVVVASEQIVESESINPSEQTSIDDRIIQEYVVEEDPISAPEIIDEIFEQPEIEELSTQSDDQAFKNPKYLVQEFLVDKFLARLEELNSADKATKSNIEETTANTAEPNSESDEFAELEALIGGNRLPENIDGEDLSDRNA